MSNYTFSNSNTADLDYPLYFPNTSIDFVNSKSIPPDCTFTRNSSGTYVGPDGLIKTANVNQPRFDYDPATGAFNGLLIEESRTNVVKYSSNFDQTSQWTVTHCTIIPNSSLAPDGTFTAATMKANAGLSILPLLSQPVGDAAVRTLTIYAKMGTYRYLKITPRGAQYGLVADLSVGSVYAIGNIGVLDANVTPAGNNWYRLQLTTDNISATRVFNCYFSQQPDNNTAYDFTGDETVYLWGAQMETGSSPTSYIPTSASTVTRQPDQLILNKSLSTSGTFFIEARPTSASPTQGTALVADNGTNSFSITPTLNTTTKNALYYNTNRVLTMSSSSSSIPVQNINYTSTSGLNRVSLGFDRFNNTNYINGCIKKFMYYDSPVTEDNLRSLTGNNKNIFRVSPVIDGPIVTSGLVLNLDAGNRNSYPGSGTTWTDLSGNGNNGTLTNGPTYSSSNGGSIIFDGVNDYISIPSSTLFNISSNDFCFEAWIYLTGYSVAYNSIYYTGQIINRDTQTTRSFTFSVSGTASSWTSFSTTLFVNNAAPTQTSALFNFSLNTWYHLVGSRIAGTVRLYVNGVDIGGGSNSTAIQNSTEAVEIGAESPSYASIGFGYYFPGRIPSVRIYSGKGLTATEVQQNFNALRGRFGI